MVPLTTLDYPGMLACVLFCQGCAWRCRYCHNPQLIPPRGTEEMDWLRVLAFLQRRQDLLDAVVFSGGEPTLQHGLRGAMDEVREMGFRIGLHSAGIKPEAFAKALDGADWVGFDVKALPEDTQLITRVGGSGAANWCSLDYLLASGVDYECRTTVHWHLFEPERLLVFARAVSTPQERLLCVSLAEAQADMADMRTLVIVGASTTRQVGRWVYTPRREPEAQP